MRKVVTKELLIVQGLNKLEFMFVLCMSSSQSLLALGKSSFCFYLVGRQLAWASEYEKMHA